LLSLRAHIIRKIIDWNVEDYVEKKAEIIFFEKLKMNLSKGSFKRKTLTTKLP